MSWGWIEGGNVGQPRELGGFHHRERAIESAIYNATLRTVKDPAIRDPLWRSLQGAGWVVEWRESWS